MQEQHFDDLQNALSEKLSEAIPEVSSRSIRDRIREQFEAARQEGRIEVLGPDEFNLLEDYRLWKAGSNAVTGLFHWKKRG